MLIESSPFAFESKNKLQLYFRIAKQPQRVNASGLFGIFESETDLKTFKSGSVREILHRGCNPEDFGGNYSVAS
jgi:hypothetical protein